MARRPARTITWVAAALTLGVLGMAVSACEPATRADAPTSPSPEPDTLARMAATLDCQLADNATLDPMVFTGASEEQAVHALEAEVRVRAERWQADVPRLPDDAMTGGSSWLLYDPDGRGHGIITAGLSQRSGSPLAGQWVAYLTDLCQSVLTPTESTQP